MTAAALDLLQAVSDADSRNMSPSSPTVPPASDTSRNKSSVGAVI